MAQLYDPAGNDDRLVAPATEHNRDVIYDILKDVLPSNGTLLEIAAGTGEHSAYFAPKFLNLMWQPTDIDPSHLRSIDAWRADASSATLLPAQSFNVLSDDLKVLNLEAPLAAALAINLIHIAPWTVAEALFEKVGAGLTKGGILYLYGPYKRDGVHTSASNEQFEGWLKARDPANGVRDMKAVTALGTKAGFTEPDVIPMPANNFSLIFRKL
ncbi:MAG: SAM-dependent methyltransferase [Kordiimonadales bacterium]|nr:MAG: SAM-dependent methyltransferase [Kordiimonadales bacterium]